MQRSHTNLSLNGVDDHSACVLFVHCGTAVAFENSLSSLSLEKLQHGPYYEHLYEHSGWTAGGGYGEEYGGYLTGKRCDGGPLLRGLRVVDCYGFYLKTETATLRMP